MRGLRFGLLPVCALAAVLSGAAAVQLRIPPHAVWQTFSDKFAGGTSSVRIITSATGTPNPHHAVKMEGQLTHYFISPFAGMQARFDRNASPQDAKKYSGVQFWARGDGHHYLVQVQTANVKDYNYFCASFVAANSWKLVRVPFKRLAQIIPGGKKVLWTGTDLTGIGFEASGFVGPFHVEVGEVALY